LAKTRGCRQLARANYVSLILDIQLRSVMYNRTRLQRLSISCTHSKRRSAALVPSLNGGSSAAAQLRACSLRRKPLNRQTTVVASPVNKISNTVIKRKLKTHLLWSPYVIGQTIIFLPCSFFLPSIFFFLFLA